MQKMFPDDKYSSTNSSFENNDDGHLERRYGSSIKGINDIDKRTSNECCDPRSILGRINVENRAPMRHFQIIS